MEIGFFKLVSLAVVVVIVLGPERLPAVSATVVRFVHQRPESETSALALVALLALILFYVSRMLQLV